MVKMLVDSGRAMMAVNQVSSEKQKQSINERKTNKICVPLLDDSIVHVRRNSVRFSECCFFLLLLPVFSYYYNDGNRFIIYNGLLVTSLDFYDLYILRINSIEYSLLRSNLQKLYQMQASPDEQSSFVKQRDKTHKAN